MLEDANKYSIELNNLFEDSKYDLDFQYFYNGYPEFKLEDSTWYGFDFASIDNEGKCLGLIGCSINRNSYYVQNLRIINFRFKEGIKSKYIFGRDVENFIKNLFLKYNFRKIEYSVYVDNIAEKMYDRLTKRYGGRIVGVKTEHERLLDGKLHDCKMYEIMKEDFINSLNKR